MNPVSINISLSGEKLGFLRYTRDNFCVQEWNSKRHNNVLDELHIVLEGTCLLEIEDRPFHLVPGSAILVRQGKFHAPLKVSSNIKRCTFLLSATPGGYLDTQLELLSHTPVTVPEEVMKLCYEFDIDSQQSLPYCTEMLISKFTILMIEILRLVNTSKTDVANFGISTDEQIMITAIDRFFEPWPDAFGSEEDLAQHLNISRHKLNRIIQKYYGMNFRQKLFLSKMDYASWFLRSTDYTCRQIAALCGYSADTAFHKAFSSHFGISPLEYRRQNKGVSQDPSLYSAEDDM